jgi:hypothetical protein
MYYLIEKATTTQGTAKAITDKSDLTSATMALHQVMASAMANPDVENVLAMIIDDTGAVQRHEYWVRNGESE